MEPRRTRGALYIATGEGHLTEACCAARSLKRQLPALPVTLFAHRDPGERAFDEVHVVASPAYALLDKVVYLAGSPYEETLYLDADTCVIGDLMPLFALLRRFDVAALQDGFRAVYRVAEVPEAFPELNTGVLVFRRSAAVQALFADWLARYRRDLARQQEWLHPRGELMLGGDLTDQPAFREAVYASDVRLATLSAEWNCHIVLPGFVQEHVRLVHGRDRDLEAAGRALNRAAGTPRTFFERFGRLVVAGRSQPGRSRASELRWGVHHYGLRVPVVAARRLLGISKRPT